MNIMDLRYNKIILEDKDTALMLDLLLVRVIGKDARRVFHADGKYMVKFWATEEEFDQIMNSVERAIGERWDGDYEELLEWGS